MKIELLEKERLDDLGRKNYKIIQNPDGFCFGMDAVLLSGYAKVKKGQRVLDLGTGTGIIPILLEAKTEASHLTGLEIQEKSADMARRSVRYNDLEDKISIVTGDIKEAGSHEVLCDLEDVVRAASTVLVPGGYFYMVHRPFRLAEIITVMTKYQLEPKRMRFVYPYVDKEPNMVLIEAKKGANSRVTVEKPLIVYKAVGEYTDEIYDIYKPEVYDKRNHDGQESSEKQKL